MRVAGIVLVAVILVTLTSAFFVVQEAEQVIITRFGKPVRSAITDPGLHMRLPFIEQVNRFEKRFLEWDGDPNQLPTRDKRFIFVDTYARWRITDPLTYYQRLRDEFGAQSRLDDILDGETRNTVANHDLIEVVRSSTREFALTEEIEEENQEAFSSIDTGRQKLAEEVLRAANTASEELGIEVLDFRFKRINYVPEVREKVYDRMKSERQRIAERFRSEGAGEAARINGERERELANITSAAYREAEAIKGRGDARAADVYAKAYNGDPDFYRFLKTMETFEATIDPDTTLLLSTEGDLLRYLKRAK